ncbi:hypothetical protein [Tenggerimyces flavus]|uniref:Uncharacterized protein n=1 Tax=Tenggerimyces flavus TaxID=1708749 RepID=A0ABV7Y4W9_9ACTN|nr:hypothetical protein [Tenggerimyces flavus]MBM7788357.1 hypothetical protein [Tenggerimyces flavus]
MLAGTDSDSVWRLSRRRGEEGGAELLGWAVVDTAGDLADGGGSSSD